MAMLVGDNVPTLSGHEKSKHQDLVGTANEGNLLVGDAEQSITDFARGGNDTLTGGDNSVAAGPSFFINALIGDAMDMAGSARGGNDILTGGDNSGRVLLFNTLIGDAVTMSGSARGGNDELTGGDSSGSGGVGNGLVGDAVTMSGSAQGGNDTLTGGDNGGSADVGNELTGDAVTMSGSAQGGNDELIGGNSTSGVGVANLMNGDAITLTDNAKGGNDVLIAGTAVVGATVRNEMWGDGTLSGFAQGGADHFVFKDTATATVGTQNFIMDFSQSQHDVIEFSGVADVTSFANLTFNTMEVPGSTVIHAGADAVRLVGFINGFTGTLTANDFLFT